MSMTKPSLVLEDDDVVDVPFTEEIRQHPLYLHFCKWLGDNRVPLGKNNYPRLFAKFLDWHFNR